MGDRGFPGDLADEIGDLIGFARDLEFHGGNRASSPVQPR